MWNSILSLLDHVKNAQSPETFKTQFKTNLFTNCMTAIDVLNLCTEPLPPSYGVYTPSFIKMFIN